MPAENIQYSEKYSDEQYEYRHVILPPDLAKLVPRPHLMTETEWRNLGVQQSPNWVHYMLHTPEPHVLLFRRPLRAVLMLPTKGYFQDIECPYFHSLCGRPYCHFRHRKKPSELSEEVITDTVDTVPTYKPTPKSQLADFHNNRSHIPISYVPDLAYRFDKKPRSTTKFENPTYNPTPLSILSSANNKNQPLTEESKEHLEVINEIKQNIANVKYDPTISLQSVADIDVDLSNEFDLIDEILSSNDKNSKSRPKSKNNCGENVDNIPHLDTSKADNLIASNNEDKVRKKSYKTEKTPGSSKKKEDGKKVPSGKSTDKEKIVSSKHESNSHHKSTKKHKSRSPSQEKSKHDRKHKNRSRSSSQEKLKSDKKYSSRNKTRSPSQEESKNDKKHKSKEKNRSRSSSREKLKNEKKHSSRDKSRSPSQEESKNGKKYKSKEKNRSRSSSQEKLKNEKKHSSRDKSRSPSQDESKNGKKYKSNEKNRSRSSSQEKLKIEKKQKSRNKSRSRSASQEKLNSDKKLKTKDKNQSPHQEELKSERKSKSKDKNRSSSEETQINDKRHKSKDKYSSQESIKNKNKHSGKEKEKTKDNSDKNKREKDISREHKSKEKHKSKETIKPSKEVSEPKNERRPSDKSDRSHHRKHKEKEKDQSHRKSNEYKPSTRDGDKLEKHGDKDKEKHKNKEKNKTDIRHEESKRQRVDFSNSEKMELNDDLNFLDEMSFPESDSDVDITEDETMLECYRIFNEDPPKPLNETESYIPQSMDSSADNDIFNEHHGKKRIAHANNENPITSSNSLKYTYSKPKTVQTPGQTLANRYKMAKMAQANREQELLIKEIQQHQSIPVKRPATTLLEAARERKRLKEKEQQSQSGNLIDDILKGTSTSSNAQRMVPKKIAPAQNVLLMAKAKERISKYKPVTVTKTVAQTQKSGRIAHVPDDVSLSDIPDVLQADKSKLPVNVRTRFLTMIADECVKLYVSKGEAYSRALKEEFNCYEKCKVLTSYRNSAMLAVNRLRKEIQERNKNGLGLISEDTEEGSNSDTKAMQFYNKLKHWVLTEEELDIHGYPRQSDEHGVAIIKNFKSQLPSNMDENQRVCCRCHRFYHVDDDGWNLFEEECCYHPMKKRTIRGEQTYLCCKTSDETGCCTSDTHVFDGFTSPRLEGFQTTMEPEFEGDIRSQAVYALDCEMCYTTKGLELTRVTIVDIDCKTVYESFVKPLNPIIDYNTKFSGITKEQMDRTSTSILQVQANILHLCNSKTILVGHSLESDLKALKIVHGNVIDTSVLFPHKMGLPHKRALRVLASEYLRKIIQNDVSGHDSAEDAITCMELLKWKLKEEVKRKPSKLF